MRSPASILARVVTLAASLFAAGLASAQQNVVLYSANDDTVNKLVAEGFAKATGIKVDVVSTGSGVLVRRVASEAANPQGDVIWGVSATLLRLASPHLQAYAAKGREAVPAQFRDPNDLWLGTNIQVVVIGQNTKAIDKAGGPKAWADLLDPKWKGKLAFTDPANSGFSYAAATTLLSLWGADDAAWTKMDGLLANAKVLNRSTQVFDGIGSGEYPLGITLEYAGFLWAHNGAPVSVAYPAEGTYAGVEGAAILKGGPNPEPAKRLVDYLASKEVQEMLLKATFRRPARQDIELEAVAPGMLPFSAVKVLPYDDTKWEAARRDTLARLKTTIQNTR
ncbi:extracellular solute-binding protein [Bradyrhizobium japonicum]|uniref:extracellular solute-binding protein n=1 Tax=Bradyrhizobium TaxID=374 RepID=UPI00200E8C5B|nr:extracellular solute-binding protein [Bradyrhizobium japonicum]UQD70019.1 extracellular solute-binding protein [Bradyrhizobium japonicum]WLB57221.1 extracellular solute-binding protein [Bradyrhizobium japonicum]WLB60885.1 extracellular solute-binding protein [Bradyrhizobium japonicum]